MNTKDLTLLSLGAAVVIFAYLMKKNGIEGFQQMPPTASPDMPPGADSSAPPSMPMGPAPEPMPQAMPIGPAPQAMPIGPAPQALPQLQPPMGGVPQPQAPGMKPNQQQLMDLAVKVQNMASEQSSIAAQLQQMTRSFMKEGFQSYQNPYSAASPGDTQAMEFRLDKKALVDSVVRY